MILYYAPGACSLATHIALIEAGLRHSLVSVDRSKKTSDSRDFLTINPKGYTPALELDDGTILTENLVLLTYIADTSGKLLEVDGLLRWRALEATAYLTSEFHKRFTPLFYPDTTQEEKDKARNGLDKHFGIIATQLGANSYLVGDKFTIADAYLFVMLLWATQFQFSLPEQLSSYFERVGKHPSVKQALGEEAQSKA